MSMSDEAQSEQSENGEFQNLSQREMWVLQMFRQLDPQRQKDIVRFIEVLIGA